MVNWRDIQDQAEKFVFSYKDAKDEDRDAKPFWKDLMMLYGVEARSVGAFEERVRIHGRPGVGKIDYFAPRKFLIEQKSRGKDLDAAYKQAMDYFDSLEEDMRPRYIIVSDFERIRIHDLESDGDNRVTEFHLVDLAKHVRELAFFTDEDVQHYVPEDPINIRAVKAIGKLYEAVKDTNHFTSEEASRLLTRLVFCFFADDTGIFNTNAIRQYIEENTKPDGSDIGAHIDMVFRVLDMDDGRNGDENVRPSTMHSALADLPYVNGGMFYTPDEQRKALFSSREMRDMLIECMRFDWSRVSPEIFGSMFQYVMDSNLLEKTKRHDLGAHYTSEENILKVINGLFLDELKAELANAKSNEAKLNELWEKIAKITLLDPACGCGNFLVVAYKELRKIENEIIARLYARKDKQGAAHAQAGHSRLEFGEFDISNLSKLSVERMHGIEIEAYPAEVAKLSLWLVDHMMNMELGALFEKPLRKLPLKEQPHIVQGNALTMDWEEVVPKEKLSYILGNPPFLGKAAQNADQKTDMLTVWGKGNSVGVLDYVTCWYKKAMEYIQGSNIEVAFVSTNSITQGEQVTVLWPLLFNLGVKINFAHRTFAWTNEAAGKAAVHCVIIGFSTFDREEKTLFDYEDIQGEPKLAKAKQINPYLVDAPIILIEKRRTPIQNVKPIAFGNMPNEGGFLILSAEEKDDLISKDPATEEFIRPLLGSEELINGNGRYCLWLQGVEPEKIKRSPEVMRRVEAVRTKRLMSTRDETKRLAETPTLFGEIRQPQQDYLAIPEVSSENRKYIPIAFLSKNVIATNKLYTMSGADLYDFGVMTSLMHMAWIRAVAGRLESRYQYSAGIVYNNFPWPGVTRKSDLWVGVEEAAQAVLDARAAHPEATLADLYDPSTMPADLLKAHHQLDKAVDACYEKKVFKSEPERLEFLFERYQRLVV